MSTRVTTWVRIDADEGCYLDDESGLLEDFSLGAQLQRSRRILQIRQAVRIVLETALPSAESIQFRHL